VEIVTVQRKSYVGIEENAGKVRSLKTLEEMLMIE
jgi:hypothetical protein